MEFEGQYLTYEEYKALGGMLDLMPFNLLEYGARNKIDLETQNRLKNSNNIPQKVKICVFNLINALRKYESENNKNKSSESVGSYSVTYKDVKQIIEDKSNELSDIILSDLYGVIHNGEHIIYRGV